MESDGEMEVNVSKMTFDFNSDIGYKKLSEICVLIKSLVYQLRNVKEMSSEIMKLESLVPLLKLIQGSLIQAFSNLISFNNDFSNISYICLNLFIKLLKKGFGEEEGEEEEKQDGQQPEGGIGMDEGKGLNDVSDQIINEDQILGTSQDNQENVINLIPFKKI